VAISTAGTLAARRRAREAGFDAFLLRPFDPPRLVSLIRSLLAIPRRVLVVDDDPDAADSLAIRLARRGFEVERAHGAAAALDVADGFRPSVVIADLKLGAESGAELASGLRARSGARALRIVAATGLAREDLGKEAELFDGFVRKPVDLDELLALIREG
jgi:DNA-binding response OmpR family regulator